MVGSVTGSVVRGESSMPERDFALKFTSVANSIRLSVNYRSARTDEAGRFALDGLRPGVWSIAYEDIQGSWRQFYAHVVANATTALEIDISETRANGAGCDEVPGAQPSAVPDLLAAHRGPAGRGGVQGEVVDASGRPVPDAAITVLCAAGDFPDIAPLTDATGRFVLDDLPVGDWVFQALAPDGLVGEGGVTVPSGRLAKMTIRLGNI